MTKETLNLGIDVKVGRPTKINRNIIMHFVLYCWKVSSYNHGACAKLRVVLQDGLFKIDHRY